MSSGIFNDNKLVNVVEFVFFLPLLRVLEYFPKESKGVIAQMGERYDGIVEVRGSIPRGSTKYNL